MSRERASTARFVVRCDLDGVIRQVVSAGADAPKLEVGMAARSIVIDTDTERMDAFLVQLAEDGSAMGFPVRAALGDGYATVALSGVVLGDELVVMGEPSQTGVVGLLEQYSELNNELVAAQRALTIKTRDLTGAIAEQEAATAEINETRRRLRALATRLDETARSERRTIAVRLHDQVSQPIAGARILQQALALRLSGEHAAQATRVADLLGDALRTSHDLAAALAPPLIYELGLEAALDWLAEGFESQYGLRVGWQCGDVSACDGDAAVLAVRFLRELLHNVHAHAGVDSAEVTCRHTDGVLTLSVTDAGRGFEDGWEAKETFGLLRIREDAESRGGTLAIETRPGAGAVVTVTFPC